MNIVVFGAAGTAGSRIVKEAASRGHQTTAVARHPAKLTDLPAGVTAREGDATSAASVRAVVNGADAVVLAIGSDDTSVWHRAAQTVTDVLRALPPPVPRLIHMGGGASLLAADGSRHLDSPHFPAAWRPAATAQAEVLGFYRGLHGEPFRWTYLSPPTLHFAPGQRTGRYRTGKDHPVEDQQGDSRISYEDFAVALVDEIENGRFLDQRFTVGY